MHDGYVRRQHELVVAGLHVSVRDLTQAGKSS